MGRVYLYLVLKVKTLSMLSHRVWTKAQNDDFFRSFGNKNHTFHNERENVICWKLWLFCLFCNEILKILTNTILLASFIFCFVLLYHPSRFPEFSQHLSSRESNNVREEWKTIQRNFHLNTMVVSYYLPLFLTFHALLWGKFRAPRSWIVEMKL